MKAIKRRLAVVLAVLLMIPAQPVMAVEALPDGIVTEREDAGYDVTAGEEDSGEDVFTADVSDVENEASGDEEDSVDADAAGAEEDLDTETESGDAETSKDAADTEISGKDGDLEMDQNAVDSEDSGDEDEPETGGDLEDGKDPADAENSEEDVVSGGNENSDADSDKNDTDLDAEEELDDMELLLDDLTPASPSNMAKVSAVAEDEVKFNTGNHVFSVVSREDFFDRELGDVFFDEDGSYTINIPEPNPFFPYEVQFTYDGKESREWFMTPDDTVEVGGHEFRVSAYFDGMVVTRMSMKVGGDVVVAYPDEKEFTDDEMGAVEPLSLLPLEERTLNLDFTGHTPVELTMISLDEIFMGNNALGSGDKVIWRLDYSNMDYQISSPGGVVDLSYNTNYSNNVSWEMIVGEDDQLSADNIRYEVNVKVTRTREWLVPTVYTQDSEGRRENLRVVGGNGYRDELYNSIDKERSLDFRVPSDRLQRGQVAYVSLRINDSLFASKGFDSLRVYEGAFTSVEEVASGTDITDRIFNVDMTQPGAGYPVKRDEEKWITIITYDKDGTASGCLPLCMEVWTVNMDSRINVRELYMKSENGTVYVTDSSKRNTLGDRDYELIHTLYKGYTASDHYYLVLNYYRENEDHSSDVTAAYIGRYATIAQAQNAGAKDIRAELFGNYDAGYAADYSQGVSFTIFVGEDGAAGQEIYHYRVTAREGTTPPPLSDITYLDFYSLVDPRGRYVDTYVVPVEDSYDNYRTLLVGENVDLTSLAPYFSIYQGANLYAEGSSTPEVSGKSYHDFSKGAIQYTVSAEDGRNSRNYWLKVVKAGTAGGKLYINSLEDEASNTREENGITYSTREMYLDGRFQYIHDILLMNIGTGPLPALSAELVSDEVRLDDYWTLNGNFALAGMDTSDPDFDLGIMELWNQAKLGIRAKDGVADGREIHGTLTIRSGDMVLMVLNLTGIVGDPGISTEDIPNAVKYVPYGTMIQNNNKYDWNTVSYELADGTLPDGMELKPNGELYGVPKQAGEFRFTVLMENSYEEFAPSERTYTLTVTENTDQNVDEATDKGYDLTQRVQNVNLYAASDQTMVSQGIYDEFVDIFLDGEKLVEGQHYTSESGSTRITIRGETLKKSNTPGKHTLGIEFRTKETNTLRRAAQNYEITAGNQSGGGSSSGGGSGSGGSSSNGNSSTGTVTRDEKKGYVNSATGIVTGAGDGYSDWHQDENGWKLVYADGTVAAGHMAEQSDGTTVEQVAWEKINGAWYAFGVNGYLKSGWVFDYQLGSWYCVSVDKGMLSGWYKDAKDGFIYYLNPATGKLAAGWMPIDGKWYYFNAISVSPTYVFDEKTRAWFYNALSKRKPYGAMYQSEETPDGYIVDADGVWNGQTEKTQQ